LHNPVLAGFGFEGRYNREPTVSSEDSLGNHFATLSDSWELGALFGWRINTWDLSATAAYGRQRFSFQNSSTATLPPGLASVSYTILRLGAGGRFHLTSRVGLLMEADYLPVLGTSQIAAAFFPRLSVGGVQGRLGGAVAVTGPFEVQVIAEYRRYFYAMNPKPGDAYVAGGALDEYITLTAGLAVRL
jgi:hypothetical protein